MTKKYNFYKITKLFNSVKDEKRSVKQPPRLYAKLILKTIDNTHAFFYPLSFSTLQFQYSLPPIKFLYHSFWSKSKTLYEKTH